MIIRYSEKLLYRNYHSIRFVRSTIEAIILTSQSKEETELKEKEKTLFSFDSISELCIIETMETQNCFENLQSDEIELNIRSRSFLKMSKIFLL